MSTPADPSLQALLQSALEKQIESGVDVGCAVAVYRGPQLVASACAGFVDSARSQPWTPQTLVLVWSATKGPAVACVLHAMDAAGIGLDSPVSAFWPEFAGANKEAITVGEVLSHRAGLSALDDSTASVLDHDSVIRAIEQQSRLWPPGSGHGYGPRVFGFILDEIVRRLSGETSLGGYWDKYFRIPHALDLWIGLPVKHHDRVAQMLPPRASGCVDPSDPFLEAMNTPGSLTRRAFTAPSGVPGVTPMNSPAMRSASIPSFGGITTADALAKFYAGLAASPPPNGDGWMSEQIHDWMTRRLSQGADEILRVETAFAAGFMMDPLAADGSKSRAMFGPGLRAFGHPGAGGSLAFGDPDSGLGFAFVMNQMQQGALPSSRAVTLVDIVCGHLDRHSSNHP